LMAFLAGLTLRLMSPIWACWCCSPLRSRTRALSPNSRLEGEGDETALVLDRG
jgi:hypothetical protein